MFCKQGIGATYEACESITATRGRQVPVLNATGRLQLVGHTWSDAYSVKAKAGKIAG